MKMSCRKRGGSQVLKIQGESPAAIIHIPYYQMKRTIDAASNAAMARLKVVKERSVRSQRCTEEPKAS
jgi:hypothetical protein